MSSISIEVKEVDFAFVGTGYGHLYLVYKDDLEQEFVIRGGPEGNIPGFLGTIVTEKGKGISESEDDRDGNTASDRSARLIDLGGRDATSVWNIMLQHAENIDQQNLEYETFSRNSNSTISSILNSIGIDPLSNMPVTDLDLSANDNFLSFDYVLTGTNDNDIIRGIGGNDVFEGGAGSDALSGGSGSDTAVFSGARSEYDISSNTNGSITISHQRPATNSVNDGTDTLVDMEFARFTDQTVNLNAAGGTEFTFLQDLSGSFSDDLPNVSSAIGGIITRIQSQLPGVGLSLSTLIDGGNYVPVVQSSTSGGGIVSAYGGFSAGGNEREAVLGALVNAANGTGLNLSLNSERIVLVMTDEPYRVSSAPDNTSIQDVIDALSANNATPIFAVTSGEVATYQDLVSQLGKGIVITITSNADNFADAVRAAVAFAKGELTELGDEGNNNIVGRDGFNDGIFGGLGDDRIDGRGGNDILDGGAGNDVGFGGSGNDTVTGGSGNDVLYGDIPTQTINLGSGNQRIIALETATIPAPALSSAFPSAIDVSNNFSLASNPNIANSTTIPHVTIFKTGTGVIDYYSVDLIPGATIIADIDGANTSNSSDSFDSFIELYDPNGNLLESDDDSNTSDGAGGSSSRLDSFLSHTITTPGQYTISVRALGDQEVPVGGTYQLHLSVDGVLGAGGTGSPGDDILDGGSGDDLLFGNGGSDILEGGEGSDTAFFAGARAGYKITKSGDVTTISRSGEVDTLTGIEILTFDDATVGLSFEQFDAAAQVYRLYQAAFDRTPDTFGLAHNANLVANGFSIFNMADAFVASAEFELLYGANSSNTTFVTALYNNVLGREPEIIGLNGWDTTLRSGQNDRGDVLFGFSESQENKNLVEATIQDGFWLG